MRPQRKQSATVDVLGVAGHTARNWAEVSHFQCCYSEPVMWLSCSDEVNSLLTCLPPVHLSLIRTLSCCLLKTQQFLRAGGALQANYEGLCLCAAFTRPLLSLDRERTSSESLFLEAPSAGELADESSSILITSDTVRKCRPLLLAAEQQQHLAHLCLG